MSADGSGKRFFAKGSNPKWSNDGLRVAFLKADDNEISQIYVKSISNESGQRSQTLLNEFQILHGQKTIVYLHFHHLMNTKMTG